MLASLELVLRRQGEPRGAGRDPGARGGGRGRSDAAGATSWRRSARCGWRRSTTRTARWRLTATRSTATRTPGRRAALIALLDRRDARGRAGRARAARPGARRLRGADALYERRLAAARRSRGARALAAQDGRGGGRAARKPGEGAGRARARAERGADAGRGARRSGAHRRLGEAAAAGAARSRQRSPDADPDAGRELALRAGRLYNDGSDRDAAERLYKMVLEGDPENVDACRRWRGCIGPPATMRGWRRSGHARRSGAGSAGAPDAADGGGAPA